MTTPPLCRDCGRELTTMASQSAGLCPTCGAKRRDAERADRLARDAIADLIFEDQAKTVIAEGYGMDSTDMTWRPQSLVRENGVVHVEEREILPSNAPVGELKVWFNTPDGWKTVDANTLLASSNERLEKRERALRYVKTKLSSILERTGWAPGSANLLDLMDAINTCNYEEEP